MHFSSLKHKNKRGLELNPIVVAVLLAATVIILGIGAINILSAYFSHLESRAKAFMNEVVDGWNVTAQTGEGNLTDVRIKRNVYLLKDRSNEIEVYSYKEVFEQKWGTGWNSSIATPVIKFDRYYTIKLPMDMSIEFGEDSELTKRGKTEVALQIDAPNADVKLFDLDNEFRRFTDADKVKPNSLDERGRKGKEWDGAYYVDKYWRWDVGNQVYYGREKPCTPPSCNTYAKLEIGVKYKRDIIGKIDLSSNDNRVKFIPKGLDARLYERKGDTSCPNFYNGNCYEDYHYYLGNSDSPVKECTFFNGDCHRNGSVMTKPNGDTCEWSPGVCVDN